jgi:hypothetical protein
MKTSIALGKKLALKQKKKRKEADILLVNFQNTTFGYC